MAATDPEGVTDRPSIGTPIVVASLQEEVYQRLRRAIQEGTLPRESVTGLRQLAADLGVSTMPVREAVRRLEAEGLLTFGRRSGIRVVRLSAAELSDIAEMRVRLETLAIERALPNIHKEALRELRSLITKMDSTTDPSDWLTHNYEFHKSILACANSPRLYNTIETLWVSVEPYLRRYAHNEAALVTANAEHRDLLDAIERQDQSAAEYLVAEHIRRVERLLLRPSTGESAAD